MSILEKIPLPIDKATEKVLLQKEGITPHNFEEVIPFLFYNEDINFMKVSTTMIQKQQIYYCS